jgi:hypothetical protein
MADDQSASFEITQMLLAWSDGRREALDDLMPVVYEDLRRMAAGYMQREPAGHALQPTALVSARASRLRAAALVRCALRAHDCPRRRLLDDAATEVLHGGIHDWSAARIVKRLITHLGTRADRLALVVASGDHSAPTGTSKWVVLTTPSL